MLIRNFIDDDQCFTAQPYPVFVSVLRILQSGFKG
jgi:hypothetical protein